ncbi:TlpA family protein disulfide reductase [bacterium]|nr:TlpA family protein disulfide reductase [bacterium]
MTTKSLSALLLAVLLAGCERLPAPSTPDGSSSPAVTNDLAASAVTNDLAAFKTADDLWAHVESYKKGPQGHPASREDLPRFYQVWFDEFDGVLQAFRDRYPTDPRRWEARLHQLRVNMLRATVQGRQPDLVRLKDGLGEVAHGEDVPRDMQIDARFNWLQIRGMLPSEVATVETRRALDTDIEAFRKDHPDDLRAAMLQFAQASLWENEDLSRAEQILQELAKNPKREIAGEARRRLQLVTLRREPLDLKFTTVDGEPFDLEQWRGKVVLIEFWATWCAPCMQELPHLIATYEKLHNQGFEIVGISLDETKAALEKVVDVNKIKWSQYFDSRGFEGRVAERFAVERIPTQMLVDKKGYLRVTELRGDLASEVEKLLAE